MAKKRGAHRAAINMDIGISGISHMVALLREMPQTMRSGIVQPIVNTLVSAGAKIAKEELKRVLPKRDRATSRWQTPTGALSDSLGHKTVPLSRMKNKNLVFGLFGSRMDFKFTRTTGRNLQKIRNFGLRRRITGPMTAGRVTRPGGKRSMFSRQLTLPHKYIHLVEFGHKKGRGPVESQPYPFIRPTRQRLNTAAPAIIRSRWATLYPQQIAKLKRRYMNRAAIQRQTQEFQRKAGL